MRILDLRVRRLGADEGLCLRFVMPDINIIKLAIFRETLLERRKLG